MKYLGKMLSQPSTYAGIAAVVTASANAATSQGHTAAILTGIMGLLAIFLDGSPATA